jgi:hypothetical protein
MVNFCFPYLAYGPFMAPGGAVISMDGSAAAGAACSRVPSTGR